RSRPPGRACSAAARARSGFAATRSRSAKRVGFASSRSGAPSSKSMLELPFARSPRPEVAFAWGSRSTTSARSPASARQAARLIAVVVFPTPPFWFAIAKVRGRMRRAYGSPRTFPALRSWTVHSNWRKRPWQLQQRRGLCLSGLGEWALLRYTGTAWEAWGRRRQLRQNEQTRELFGWSAAEAPRHRAHALGIRARPDPQDNAAAENRQGQAPLGCHGRRGKRLRDNDAELLGFLLLGSALDDHHVRELSCDPRAARSLRPLRRAEAHLPAGQRPREGDARGTATRPDIDDRPREPLDRLNCRKALLDVDAMRSGAVADRGQTWCRKKKLKPALEARIIQQRSRRTGSARCPRSTSPRPGSPLTARG